MGLSEGTHDNGCGETGDVSAALNYLANEFPGAPVLVAGFSFGAAVGLLAGCADLRVIEMIGLGLPVNNLDARYLRVCTKPKLLIQGTEDQYGSKKNWEELLAGFPPVATPDTQAIFIHGADHFFTGHIEEVTRALGDWLVQRHPLLRSVGT